MQPLRIVLHRECSENGCACRYGKEGAEDPPMDVLPNLVWPAVVQCVFMASLHGGQDPSRYAYQSLSVEPATCAFVAYVHGPSLVLELGQQRVEVPLPTESGWHDFSYAWGERYAWLDQELLAVRMGPVGLY